MTKVVRLEITLRDTDPAIWRRVEALSSVTLKQIHTIIQAAMGWEDCHLYQFRIGREAIDGPGFVDDVFGSGNVTADRVGLEDLLARGLKKFDYLYDMGDSWEHKLKIEKITEVDPAMSYPRFLDGAGACPPEDIGGIPGFYEFLEAMGDPNHPDHEMLMEWNGGRFEPAALDGAKSNKRLAKLAPRKKRKP